MANNVTANDIEPFGDIAAEVEHMAWTHGITAAPDPIDMFAKDITRLCDQDIQLDRIEMLLVKLQRAGLLDSHRGVELHAAYLRQQPAVLERASTVRAAESSGPSAEMLATMEALDRAAEKSLVQRRAGGGTMIYASDGWMVVEHPGGRIERLCPANEFRVTDYPHLQFTTPPTR